MRLTTLINLFIIIIFLFQCTLQNKDCDNYGLGQCNFQDCSHIPNHYIDSIDVIRTEHELMKIKNNADFELYAKKYPEIAKRFLFYGQYPTKKLVKKLVPLTTDLYFDTLYQEVYKYYPNLNQVKRELGFAFHRLKKLDYEWKNPPVHTIMTGFVGGCDLAYQNNTILVGLDWFMDIDAKYRAPDQPKYILDRMTPRHLSSAILLLLSNKYNRVDGNDNTLLAEMLSYGKAYEFVHQLLPCIQDSIILGYTSKQMAEVKHNQSVIWKHFLDNELLYSTKQKDKRDYVFEAPLVQAIDNKCPGRIGRWLGWQIIKSYINNNNVKLKELLNNIDYQEIFSQSGYRPIEIDK